MSARQPAVSDGSAGSDGSTRVIAAAEADALAEAVDAPGVPAEPDEHVVPPAFGTPLRRALIFTTVALGLLLSGVDQTIVASALPPMETDLGAGIEWTSWTITIYSLGQVMIMPLAGKLSDLYGRKLIFLLGAALFAVASVCCGFAPNVVLLIVFRGLQAIGGAAFMPSASGIIADTFGPSRDRALGMFTAIFPIGAVAGPVLGGLVVSVASWREIFFVSVPVALLLIVLGVFVLPVTPRRSVRALDVPGVLLMGGVILSAMFGIAFLGDGSRTIVSPWFLVPELLALVFVGFFILRIRTAQHPFIPPRFLVGKGFGILNVINLLHGAAGVGFASLVPLYAEYRFGIDPLRAGGLLSARALGMAVVAALAVYAMRRLGSRIPMQVGSSVAAIGLFGLALVPPTVDPWAWLFVAGGVAGVGVGFAIPASNNAILHLAPHDVAQISGLRGMFRHAGSIISVSIATALIARSTDPGGTLTVLFGVFAGVMLCLIPIIFFVPDRKGSW